MTRRVPLRIGSTRLGGSVRRAVLVLAVLTPLLVIAARPANSQTGAVIWGFHDPALPSSGLTFDAAGNLYGTAYYDFDYSTDTPKAGAVFELSPNRGGGWNENVVYAFCSASNCTDGGNPSGDLIFDSAGNLYGTTSGGGANGYGVVFKLTPSGGSWTETVLYSFCSQTGCTDGLSPASGVIFDGAGNLYGIALGAPESVDYVVFKLSPTGSGWTEEVIYNIGLQLGNSGLSMDSCGNIFGVGFNSVFELSPNGSGGWNPTTIYTFPGYSGDGRTPEGTPAFDKAGNLYGTTVSGGSLCRGTGGCGTVYELNPAGNVWTEKILHNFGSKNDGSGPVAGIVFDKVGNIYGTSEGGGQYRDGTVYELVTSGIGTYTERVLWAFDIYDGLVPTYGVVLDSSDNLYGTTEYAEDTNGVAFEVTAPPSKPATSALLASSLDPSSYGQKVTFTTTVTGSSGFVPTGRISLISGINTLGTVALNSSGVATLTMSSLDADTYLLTAVYKGDTNNLGSISPALNQVVQQTTSAAMLTTSMNPSTAGQAVTFTAKITSPTVTAKGQVTFTSGVTVLGTVELSGGKATLTTSSLSAGSTHVTVTFSGDSNIKGSFASVTQEVQP